MKLRLGALALFQKTNSKGLYNIASWHSPHSLTWSWILSVHFDGIWRHPPTSVRKGLRLGFHTYRGNQGLQWSLVAPFVVVSWKRQREMWYRDMYRRCWSEREALEQANSKLRRALREHRALVEAPVSSPTQ